MRRDIIRRHETHNQKDDGFRIIARPGNGLTHRFPLIVETLARLRSRSCIIDGEAVACDDNGIASFNLIRYRRHDDGTFLYAFDLIELDGDDLRRDALEMRKATLRSMQAGLGLRFNEHMEGDGPTVFANASWDLKGNSYPAGSFGAAGVSQVLGLFLLFGIGVASLILQIRGRLG